MKKKKPKIFSESLKNLALMKHKVQRKKKKPKLFSQSLKNLALMKHKV